MCSLAAPLASFIPDDSSLLEGSFSIHSFGTFNFIYESRIHYNLTSTDIFYRDVSEASFSVYQHTSAQTCVSGLKFLTKYSVLALYFWR